MCQVFDKSKTGIIIFRMGIITPFQNRYGDIVGGKVYAKVRNKIDSCKRRGIDFKITWEMLDLLIDKWILSEGVCDYSGEKFVEEADIANSPTLERIDSSLPYEEGNLCVITKKVNSFKGRLESGSVDKIVVKEEERPLFNVVFGILSSINKVTKIRNQYIPNKQEKEMATATISTTAFTPIPEETSVPEDIQISKVYYTLMNFFINSDKVVNITFAQFRRLYKFKNCFLSGQAMTADNKSPLLLGDEVNKDTLRFALEDYATPFQTLIDKKGMTPTLLKNMLNKNIK